MRDPWYWLPTKIAKWEEGDIEFQTYIKIPIKQVKRKVCKRSCPNLLTPSLSRYLFYQGCSSFLSIPFEDDTLRVIQIQSISSWAHRLTWIDDIFIQSSLHNKMLNFLCYFQRVNPHVVFTPSNGKLYLIYRVQ